MKFYINRSVVDGPWGGGNNFVKAMYDYLPNQGFDIIEDPYTQIPDIIFLQSPKADSVNNFSINEAIRLKIKFPNIKIAIRVNECDARKGTKDIDKLWIECSKYVDKTFFVSKWMKEYFIEKGWQCNENYIVYNGVDLNHFNKREKINNNRINIVTHHWSNNYLKGFDIYDKLDEFVKNNEKYTFTYIGRTLNTFKNTRVIDPLFGIKLGNELSKYDLYISASRWDPGPNHILESLACEIPTYVHVDGGGCVEFINDTSRVYFDYEDLINKIKIFKNEEKCNLDCVTDWENCIIHYSKSLQR